MALKWNCTRLVLHDLVRGGGVRPGPAIAGTVLWGLASAGYTINAFSIGLSGPSFADGETAAFVLIPSVVSLSSLALSIYGLTRPSPGSAPATRSPRVTALPMLIPAARGAAPGLSIAFAL